ncbi:HNH endonuclease [Streptosporangium sp. G12]
MSGKRYRPRHTRGVYGQWLRERLAVRDGARCFYCWKPYEDPTLLTFDHYVPSAVWRCSEPWNLVLACPPCNEAKADKLPWPLVWLLLARARGVEVGERSDRPKMGGLLVPLPRAYLSGRHYPATTACDLRGSGGRGISRTLGNGPWRPTSGVQSGVMVLRGRVNNLRRCPGSLTLLWTLPPALLKRRGGLEGLPGNGSSTALYGCAWGRAPRSVLIFVGVSARCRRPVGHGVATPVGTR